MTYCRCVLLMTESGFPRPPPPSLPRAPLRAMIRDPSVSFSCVVPLSQSASLPALWEGEREQRILQRGLAWKRWALLLARASPTPSSYHREAGKWALPVCPGSGSGVGECMASLRPTQPSASPRGHHCNQVLMCLPREILWL